MKRKEVLIAAVVGGCIGAVLTMSVGLFMPGSVVAQSYNHEFGAITCRVIKVVDERGITRGYMSAYGGIGLCDTEGKKRVAIGFDDNGGGGVFVFRKGGGTLAAEMGIDKHGGVVAVYNTGSRFTQTQDKRAAMSVNAFGNGAVSTWDKNGYRQ